MKPASPFDAVPSHSIEAEQATLGAMLIDRDAVPTVLEIVQKQDFYREGHQRMMECIADLHARDMPIDLLTVPQWLTDHGQLDTIGGMGYLANLFDTVPTAANVSYYAGIVKDKAIHRRLYAAGLELLRLAGQEDQRGEDLIEKAEQHVFSLTTGGQSETGSPLAETITRFEAKLAAYSENPGAMLGVSTGLPAYDDLSNGLQKSDLTILLGNTGMCKSALMGKMAVSIATAGQPVLIASNEMSREQVYVRMACEIAGVDSFALRRSVMSSRDWDAYNAARDMLYELPIYIDEQSSQTPGYIRSVARRVAAKYGSIGAIFSDYIQIMAADKPSGNETQDLGKIANAMKSIARDMKVPVVLLCQMNREAEKRENKRPTLGDIRQSGEIAQAADVVCGLHREEYYTMKGKQGLDTSRVQEVELLFLKHRNGAEGSAKVGFIARYTQFTHLDGLGAGEPTGF